MSAYCEICGKKVAFRFSPDMDIAGIGSCKKHKDDVGIAYLILITQGEKEYRFIIDGMKKNNKKKTIKIKRKNTITEKICEICGKPTYKGKCLNQS